MKETKYHVQLTDAGRKRFREITEKGNLPVRRIIRANILLCLDGNGTGRPVAEQEVIVKRCGCHVSLVYRVSKQYEREGLERVLNRKARETPPVPPVVTGEVDWAAVDVGAKTRVLSSGGQSSDGVSPRRRKTRRNPDFGPKTPPDPRLSTPYPAQNPREITDSTTPRNGPGRDMSNVRRFIDPDSACMLP
jgi:hypothetical protein